MALKGWKIEPSLSPFRLAGLHPIGTRRQEFVLEVKMLVETPVCFQLPGYLGLTPASVSSSLLLYNSLIDAAADGSSSGVLIPI